MLQKNTYKNLLCFFGLLITGTPSLGFVILSLILVGCASAPKPNTPPSQSAMSFEGHMIWKQTNMEYDPPGIVFRALFDDPDKLRRDPYESRILYEQRIKAINECSESFIFLIPPEYCDYWFDATKGDYTVVAKDAYLGSDEYIYDSLYGVTVYESETPNRDEQSESSTPPFREVWKLALVGFDQYPAELIQTDGEQGRYPHFGLSFHLDSSAFGSRLIYRKIGLALRVRLGDCRNARVHYDGPGLGAFSSDSEFIATYYLPVEVLDIWVVDTGTDYSLVQWLRDYL